MHTFLLRIRSVLFISRVANLLFIFTLVIALSACSGSGGSNSETGGVTAASTSGTNPDQVLPPGIVASPSMPVSMMNNTPVIAGSSTSSPTGLVASPNPSTTNSDSSNANAGSSLSTGGTTALSGPAPSAVINAPPEQPLSEKGAFRLLQQATFGPTEAGMTEAMVKGPRRWLAEQFAMPVSTFGFRDRDAIHKWPDRNSGFCDQFASGTPERETCWRDWYSSDPLKIEFFKQASIGTDQLRQRMGHALSQILVVSAVMSEGTYGMADYFQMLRDKSFGNYRDVLTSVTLHPVMGDYLNMVNNDADDPNENFARELLQLFAIGTCELNTDGTLKTRQCVATYDNAKVREYAFALTGWTYPSGGVNPWCNPSCNWTNPRFLRGAMLPVATQHDQKTRSLLSGINLPATRTPATALNSVVDSLMNHPNIGPFIGKQLIQFFVTSNPTPAYVGRVATAFNTGKFETFGIGQKGDLQATLAAILLDDEARLDASATNTNMGKLREPIVMMVSAVRALNGFTDGERMGLYGWGSSLSQPVFNSPSVFNFYSPDYPLPAGASTTPGLVAPQFQLINANTTLGWINFTNDLVYWWYNKNSGLAPKADMVGSTGTRVSYTAFERDAADPTKLIARLDRLLTGGVTSAAGRSAIADALNAYTSADTWLTDVNNQSSWQRERVKTAAYLMIASPHFQVQR